MPIIENGEFKSLEFTPKKRLIQDGDNVKMRIAERRVNENGFKETIFGIILDEDNNAASG